MNGVRSSALIASAWVGLTVLCSLGNAPSQAADISEVVELVAAKGWKANLGRICSAFGLDIPDHQCVFRQVSVQEIEGRGDPRGFNVPPSGPGGRPDFIVMFHLGPLVGEFFVASPGGELLKAFYRAKGREYEELPLDHVREEFERDLQYWLKNLSRVRSGLGAQ